MEIIPQKFAVSLEASGIGVRLASDAWSLPRRNSLLMSFLVERGVRSCDEVLG
jgi:hypothetical protein